MTPLSRGLLGGAALMALSSGACYSLIAEVDTVSCDRDAGGCEVTRVKVYRTSIQPFPVAELTGADLRPIPGPEPDDNTTNMTVRVVILTDKQPIPFMTYASAFGLSGMEADVNAVSRYVASPSVKRLDLRRDNRMWAALAALGPFALSALLLFLAFRTTRGGRF